MEHARTIAMATTLLADGRAEDVAQMIDPLLEPVDAPAASTGQILLHALLARVEIVHRNNPDRGLELLPSLEEVEALCTCARAEVALWRGWAYARKQAASDRTARALRLLKDAQGLFDSIQDPTGRCWSILGQAQAYFALDEYALMRHVLEEAEPLLERLRDEQADRWFHELSIPALRFDGRYEEARHHVSALQSIADTWGVRRIQGTAAAHTAALRYDTGQSVSSIRDAAESALALLGQVEHNASYPLLATYHALVGALLRHGSWTEALDRIDEAEEALSDDPIAQAHLKTLRARHALRQRNLERANELLDDLVDQAHHLPHGLHRSHVALLHGELLARRGQLDDALTWMKRAHRNACETGHRGNQLRTLLTLARTAAAREDLEAAHSYLDASLEYDDYFSVLPFAVRRFAAEGTLAQTEGREEEALQAYRQARSAASMIENRHREASLQLALAQLEDTERANTLASTAYATFEDLDAEEEMKVADAIGEAATATDDDASSARHAPFGPDLPPVLARASLSVPLVAEAWLQRVNALLPERWTAIYRVSGTEESTLVHQHGTPPSSTPAPPPASEQPLHDSIQWIRLRSPTPSFYLGVQADTEESAWTEARAQMQPWIPVVELAFDRALLHQETPSSEKAPEPTSVVDGFVAESPAMASVANQIRRIHSSHNPVLITGEDGSGKCLVARAIHETSERSPGPFERVSCSPMQHNPIEAHLFGTVDDEYNLTPGAVHAADGGTLLIENGDVLPPDAQSSLLHLLEAGEVVPVGGTEPVPVDVRVIVTSTADLNAQKDDERFRRELYDRLRVISLHVPPLRERRPDIPLLVRHFLNTLSSSGSALASVTNPAMEALLRYHWPGNVRQLRNEIERALLHVQSEPAPTIDQSVLLDTIVEEAQSEGDGSADRQQDAILHPEESLRDVLARTEKSVIERVLEACDGQITASADVLGLTRQGLYKKMKRLNIDASTFQPSTDTRAPVS